MNKVGIAAITVLALPVFVYAVDYLSLRLRIPNREPFGTVQVQVMYAVALKNRSTEYMPDQPRQQQCVTSLFPHYGNAPCWYLVRHPRQIVKLGSNPNDIWQRYP